MTFFQTTFNVIADSVASSGGEWESDPVDISNQGKKTFYIKADAAGEVAIEFEHEEEPGTWDEVFRAEVSAGEQYVNTFRDNFPPSIRIKYYVTAGDTTIRYCKFISHRPT